MRKGRCFARVAMLGCGLVLAVGAASHAAEVKVLAVGAMPGVFKELVPPFERASGHKVSVEYGATPALMKKIDAGEAFDVAVLVTESMNDPARQGLFAGARPAIASVGLGAAVRAGAPKPDIGSAEAFKQALLKAKSVSIIPGSVNGQHFLSVFARLGIRDEMNAKLKPVQEPSQVAEAVAKGEAEMALFISNVLVSVPGVDYVGLVPAEFQQILVFSVAAGAKSKDPAAATAFVQHLTTPAAKAAVKANGMDVP